jgi:hypothetical protein
VWSRHAGTARVRRRPATALLTHDDAGVTVMPTVLRREG